jgi:hypothetical protein
MERQKVPMLENIQYQNAMIRHVPPHAATYRRISQSQTMIDLPFTDGARPPLLPL